MYMPCYGKKHNSKIQIASFSEFSCKININFVKTLVYEILYMQQNHNAKNISLLN